MFARFFKREEAKVHCVEFDTPNLFYYDETLKRWCERGREHLQEDAMLPPPPATPPKAPPAPQDAEVTVLERLMAPPSVYSTRIMNLRNNEKKPSPARIRPGIVFEDKVAEVQAEEQLQKPKQPSPLERQLRALQHLDLELCAEVCTALDRLSFDDLEQQVAIIQSGAVQQLLEALQLHQDKEASRLQPLLELLWNLTFEPKGVEAVAVASLEPVMRKHLADVELQVAMCALLLNIAVREENRQLILHTGLADLICQALEMHQDEQLLEHGCQALYMLACHPALRPSLAAAGALRAARLAAARGKSANWGAWLQELLMC